MSEKELDSRPIKSVKLSRQDGSTFIVERTEQNGKHFLHIGSGETPLRNEDEARAAFVAAVDAAISAGALVAGMYCEKQDDPNTPELDTSHKAGGVPMDHIAKPGKCDCTTAPGDYNLSGWEMFSYRRACASCGKTYFSCYCPHDEKQSPCRHCGVTPSPIST